MAKVLSGTEAAAEIRFVIQGFIYMNIVELNY